MSEPTMSTDEIPGLAPWVESIQALKDDVDESAHVLTVLGLALVGEVGTTGPLTIVSVDAAPLLFHAYEVLQHYGLVTMVMTEAPGCWRVEVTPLGRAALAQAMADREADIANREGQMR